MVNLLLLRRFIVKQRACHLDEVIMSLEDKFNINIDDRDAQRWVTIGDTIAFIKSKVS